MKIVIILSILAVIAIISITLTGINIQQNVQKNKTIATECTSDSDCFISGCSGQICSNKPNVITTCEYREYYSCYKLTSCNCIDGKCQWKNTPEFNTCLEQKGFKMR